MDAKGKHSLSVCVVARGFPFVVPSVALVNSHNDPGIIDKPDDRKSSPVVLRGAWKSLYRLEHDQRVPGAQDSQPENAIVLRCSRMCWKELNTKPKGGIVTYRLSSSRRLCSTTSLGRE